MSNEEPDVVSSEELSTWLKRDRNKQEMMAERLFVSSRTIDGWRNGRTIPTRYHLPIRKMMRGEDSVLLSFSPEMRARIAARAKEKNYNNVEAYLTELLKGFLALALLAIVSYQAFSPGEHHLVRRVGRKRSDIAAIELEADEV